MRRTPRQRLSTGLTARQTLIGHVLNATASEPSLSVLGAVERFVFATVLTPEEAAAARSATTLDPVSTEITDPPVAVPNLSAEAAFAISSFWHSLSAVAKENLLYRIRAQVRKADRVAGRLVSRPL